MESTRITQQAVEFFESVGSSAGQVHRVCLHRHSVYPIAATMAINKIASNGKGYENTRILHEAVFDLSREIDANIRHNEDHSLSELTKRVEKLENKGFWKWLGSTFNPDRQKQWLSKEAVPYI